MYLETMNILKNKFQISRTLNYARLFTTEAATWSPKKRVSRMTMDKIRALNAAQPEVFNPIKLSEEFKLSAEAIRRILKSKYQPLPDDAERQEKNRYEAMGERRKQFQNEHSQFKNVKDKFKKDEENPAEESISQKKQVKNTWKNENITRAGWKPSRDSTRDHELDDRSNNRMGNRERRSFGSDDTDVNERRQYNRRETGSFRGREDSDRGSGWRERRDNNNESSWNERRQYNRRETDSFRGREDNDSGSSWRERRNSNSDSSWNERRQYNKRESDSFGDRNNRDSGSGWREKRDNNNESSWNERRQYNRRESDSFGDRNDSSRGSNWRERRNGSSESSWNERRQYNTREPSAFKGRDNDNGNSGWRNKNQHGSAERRQDNRERENTSRGYDRHRQSGWNKDDRKD